MTIQPKLLYRAREPDRFPAWSFPNVDLTYHAETQSVWMSYKADGPPCYTFQTLSDMADVRESLQRLFAAGLTDKWPIRYFVMASNKPGIFNLGGDLTMFANSIKAHEQEILRGYAHACIDVVYGLITAFNLPIVTLAVVNGQALGGGLEAALAEDFLIADEGAKLGVPEVVFNTFPGMGAITLLTRRLGSATAEQIITSGKSYSGREMHELGVVDILASEGRSKEEALAWMLLGGEERWRRRLSIANVRRRCFPISFYELIKITDIWADCALDVTDPDIRYMERLASAQKKFAATA